MSEGFQFKQFYVRHDRCAMKVGTDGVLLGALAWGCNGRILDIGTGTGLCALMMAQRYPEAAVTGIDIDAEACQQAKENTSVSKNISIVNTSLQDYASEEKYDAILSNPPFFEEALGCPDKYRDMARHTSSLPYSLLLSRCKQLLAEDGTLTLIIPTQAVPRIEEESAYNGLFIVSRLHIKTKSTKAPKRTLLYLRHHPSPPTTSEHVLMDNGQRSQWYAEVTRDFYL